MPIETGAHTGELKNLLPASLLVRCSAMAVDLCLTVAACALALALMSMATPADSAAAKLPILLILIAACVYIGWGRMRLASAGRGVFRLQVARLAEPSARPGRPLTVHRDVQPVHSTRAVGTAFIIMASCALLTTLALTQVLSTTTVFSAVKLHAQSAQPFAARYGAPPTLSTLPTAVLIGEQRAYVQVGAKWGEQSGLLDYYLIRREGRWQVRSFEHARERLLARYALTAPEKDIPTPPQ